jgi:nucleoside-diphosphate-sugar epimerase
MALSDTAPPKSGAKCALVTGANGFMGTHMTDLLAQQGIGVVATDLDRTSTHRGIANYVTPFRYQRCDIRSARDVRALLVGTRFDYVFHIAALFNYGAAWDDLLAVNVQGSKNLLNGLSENGIQPERVVTWGSGGIYAFAKDTPAHETSDTKATGAYLSSKLEAETEMFAIGGRMGIPVTSVRPGGVYGPRSRYGVATPVMMAARGGLGPFCFGSSKTRASLVHGEDVCRAALFLAKRPEAAGEAYNVGDDSRHSTTALLRLAAERLDFPFLPGNFPLAMLDRAVQKLGMKAAKKNRIPQINREMTALFAQDALLDTGKLKALGWTPKYPDAKDGLMATIDWYEREGWL